MVGQDRLWRLTHAQAEMVKALEVKLTMAERAYANLSATRKELDSLLAGGDQWRLAFVPVAFRRLIEIDAQLRQAHLNVDQLRQKLLAAKGRHKALARRARLGQYARERKAGEEEALETFLVIGTKASGKPDMVS